MTARWTNLLTVAVFAALTSTSVSASAATYTIDGSKSTFVVKTKVEGIASRFGHNHVIVGRKGQGQVTCPSATPEGCSVVVSIATKNLRIDADGDRKRFGMKGTVPAGDRKTIEEEMRGKEQLHTKKFKTMGFKSTALKKSGAGFVLQGGLTIRGKTKQVSVPVTATANATGFTLKGKTTIKQSDFGYEPYSKFGAISNADAVSLTVNIVATAIAPAPIPTAEPTAPPAKTAPPPAKAEPATPARK